MTKVVEVEPQSAFADLDEDKKRLMGKINRMSAPEMMSEKRKIAAEIVFLLCNSPKKHLRAIRVLRRRYEVFEVCLESSSQEQDSRLLPDVRKAGACVMLNFWRFFLPMSIFFCWGSASQ